MTVLELRAGRQELEDRGAGRPVLWLASSFGEATWTPAQELLSSSRRIIAPHPPTLDGVLASINEFPGYVMHIEDILDALGIERAVVVGASFGGWLAVELAARSPQRVESMVLIDALGLRIPEEPVPEIFACTLAQLARLLLVDHHSIDFTALPTFDPSADRMESVSRLIVGEEAMARVGWSPYLHDPSLESIAGRYRGPALVLWGAEDRVLPKPYAHRWRDLLGARLEIVEGAGHLPAIEKPEVVAHLIRDWLDELPS